MRINNRKYLVDADPDMPLLWVVRDLIGLTGTKYGCGKGICGACILHVDEKPVRSCLQILGEVAEKKITTIEGLSQNNDHPVQKAWIDAQAPQCGYCHSGQIMIAASVYKEGTEEEKGKMEELMNGVLCRCGTYPRIKKAIDKLFEGSIQ